MTRRTIRVIGEGTMTVYHGALFIIDPRIFVAKPPDLHQVFVVGIGVSFPGVQVFDAGQNSLMADPKFIL